MEHLLDALLLNLEHPVLRMAVIIGLAVGAALLLRITVLPLLRRLTRKTQSAVDDRILDQIWPAVLRTLVLEGVHLATLDFVEASHIDVVVDRIAITLIILIWTRVIAEVGEIIMGNLSRSEGRFDWIQPQTLPLMKFVFKVLLFGILIYLLMTVWGVNLTSWLASAGVIGIAVGFAAKDTLANFFSGVFILADAPYRVGQYIIIDDLTRGVVTEIGMRSTRLLTRDNVEVTVPNAIIGNAKIVNESSGPSLHMRVRVQFSVAYGSDPDQVRSVVLASLEELTHLEKGQETSVRFVAMGESSLDFQILVWITHPVFRGRAIDEINTRVYKALGEAGIEIPFPQRDLNIKSWPSPPTG